MLTGINPDGGGSILISASLLALLLTSVCAMLVLPRCDVGYSDTKGAALFVCGSLCQCVAMDIGLHAMDIGMARSRFALGK